VGRIGLGGLDSPPNPPVDVERQDFDGGWRVAGARLLPMPSRRGGVAQKAERWLVGAFGGVGGGGSVAMMRR